MLLKDLIKGLDLSLTKSQEDIDIKDICIDLEKLKKGDLFIDLKGDININEILEKQPGFVIRFSSKNRNEAKNIYSFNDIRRLFALVCKNHSNSACDNLKIIGITGTNGKTSTAKIVSDIIKKSGKKVATIGTMGCEFASTTIETGFTTPDPNILHDLFFKIKKSGIEYVVMEVSAHAIFLKKLEGIRFEVLAITNITQDHLDFFKTMDNYASTKLSFFDKKHAKQAVVCADDTLCRSLMSSANIPIISYGVDSPSDIFAIDVLTDFSGTEFICNCLDEVFRVNSRLVGEYNVLNTLCAIGICSELGISFEHIYLGILDSESEVGRFNTINFNDINIVIDYAHTPDGLEKVLRTAKTICKNKLRVVFGCGGNRDSLKRPLMGSIAEIYSDSVILTSDNPRFEKPLDIIEDIKKGMTGHCQIEEDRKKAIHLALSQSERGDCVIIAGKGGEQYQDINGVKKPYNDFEVVYSYFRKGLTLFNHKGVKYGN